MLVDMFDKHFDSGLYTLKYHLASHMVEDILKLELYLLCTAVIISVLMYRSNRLKKNFAKKWTEVTVTVIVMEKRYEIVLLYGRKKNDRSRGR